MIIIDEERINQLTALTSEEKTTLAQQNFNSIIEKMQTKGEGIAEEVKENIHIFATNVLFKDYAFSVAEEKYLKDAIGLEEEKATKLRYDCDEYLYSAIDVFRTYLDDDDKKKLYEIMFMLTAVDTHSTKKELRLVRKLLSMI